MSMLVHMGLAAMLVIGSWNINRHQRDPVGLNIEAVIVDMEQINQQIRDARAEAERAERKRQRDEALAARREQERQQLEQQRQEDAARERKADIERQRQAQIERQRQAELAEQKIREQQAELEKIRQQRLEAEQKIQQQQDEMRRLAEQRKAADTAAEEERRKLLLAQEETAAVQAGRMATLRDQYIAAIANAVSRNWLRPPTAKAGLRCELMVQQVPGGSVTSAEVNDARCNADEATKRSIEAAVRRAGQLPYADFRDVFERDLVFTFKYDGD